MTDKKGAKNRFAERQAQTCARCGQPRWMHSIWAAKQCRELVKQGGCLNVEDFQEDA